MSPLERIVRRVDRYQQSHGWIGFPFAVLKKFGDDRGGALAGLLAYYGILSLFPLLLLMTTLFGIFRQLSGSPHRSDRLFVGGGAGLDPRS